MLIKYLLNGKGINLTVDNITITSNNFKVDKNGNIVCSNATISGKITAESGKIANYTISGGKLIGENVGLSGKDGEGWAFWSGSNDATHAPFRVGHDGSFRATNAEITGGTINLSADIGDIKFKIYDESDNKSYVAVTPIGMDVYDSSNMSQPLIAIGIAESDYKSGDIRLINSNNNGEETQIHSWGISTPSLQQTSVVELKKNIEKLQNGLEVVKNTDIYKYNFKTEKDTDRKHIGFVIGKDYHYSKEITAVNKEGKETGADIYSMVSVLYKAMQEVSERLEKLEEVQNEKDNI